MRAVFDGLAESPIREQAPGAIVFADAGGDIDLPILKQDLDHLLKKFGWPAAIGTSSMNSKRNHSTYCASLIPSSVHRRA